MDNADILMLVFQRLGERELAMASCCCQSWRQIGHVDHFWRALCTHRWPTCETPGAVQIIEAMGGFRIFFSRRAASIMNYRRSKQMMHPIKPWLRLEDLTFFVDLAYKGAPILSEVILGTVFGSPCSVRLRIEPPVASEPILPKNALTAVSFQGQTFYEKPFQAEYTAKYWLNWSVLRSVDHKMACLLDSDPVHDKVFAWEEDGDDGGDDFCWSLYFEGDLLSTRMNSCRLKNQKLLLAYACLDCKAVWGESLSDHLVFELVELQLGVRESKEEKAPSIDKLLMAFQELDWI